MSAGLLGALALQLTALGQSDRPAPLPANGPQDPNVQPEKPAENAPPEGRNGNDRPPGGDELLPFTFNEASIDEAVRFIAEATGKTVVPIGLNTTLKAKKFTIINDKPIPRDEALDLLFQAFRLNEIGVIEKDDQIIIAMLTEIGRFDPPVFGPEVDISDWTNKGTIIIKIYALRYQEADSVRESLEDVYPDANIAVDVGSNRLIVQSDVGLCQAIQKMLDDIDNNSSKPHIETFRLRYADASGVQQQILDLFEDTGTSGSRTSSGRRTPQTPAGRRTSQTVQRARASEGLIGDLAIPLLVSVNIQQNSVTVSGDPLVVKEIARLIEEDWDLERPQGTAKVYVLQYTDPIKMRDLLQDALGDGGGGALGGRGGAAGQSADVADIVAGIFQITAYPDSNSLVVISKTEDALAFLDNLIEQLDQPLFPGLPLVVELKHADAEEVADQVNALLARAGTRADVFRRQRGLVGFDITGPSGDGGGTGGEARESSVPEGAITFPWQSDREQEDETPGSPLIGRIRVVPVHRQNAVMILAPPEYRQAVYELIVQGLDTPGRQVMIAAVIAEIELTDEFALGVRFSNSDSILTGPLVDNRFATGFDFTGQEDPLFNFLDLSVLDINASANVVLQALDQDTNVRILQQPQVFTSDNQEASFFEGQDVPILASTQTTAEGTVNETVNYQEVGVGLNVRPRITVEGDVDMEINLEISNIVPGVQQFNSPVFDRRETTTQIIVKNGQTIVISGIMKDIESQITRGVPLLSDIPLIGEIFKSRENSTTRSELVAFITPWVVSEPRDNDRNFNLEELQHLEDLMMPLADYKKNVNERAQGQKLRERLLYRQYRKHVEDPESIQTTPVNPQETTDG